MGEAYVVGTAAQQGHLWTAGLHSAKRTWNLKKGPSMDYGLLSSLKDPFEAPCWFDSVYLFGSWHFLALPHVSQPGFSKIELLDGAQAKLSPTAVFTRFFLAAYPKAEEAVI